MQQHIDKRQILLYKDDQVMQAYDLNVQDKKKSLNDLKNYYTCLQCIKNLHYVDINGKKAACYETVLVINPLLEINNALPRDLTLGVSHKAAKQDQKLQQCRVRPGNAF